MKHILIFGAGRSSISLLTYLTENALKCKWKIKVADTEESN